jgi:hypothetical protein
VAHAGAGWRGPAMESPATKMDPPSPTDFSPQALLWQQGPRAEPQVHLEPTIFNIKGINLGIICFLIKIRKSCTVNVFCNIKLYCEANN